MCINQILFDEQAALIACTMTQDPQDLHRHRRILAGVSRLMAPYPYPHRPYDPWAMRARGSSSPSCETGTR